MQISETITNELDRMFPILDSQDILQLCDQVEVLLRHEAVGVVAGFVRGAANAGSAPVTEPVRYVVGADGRDYLLEHAFIGGTLTVAVTPVNPPAVERQLDASSHRLEGNGVCSYVTLKLPSHLEPIRDAMAETLTQLYSASYRWLEARVLHGLERYYQQASSDLYLCLRKRLSEEVFEQVWLYVIVDGIGRYVVDGRAGEVALDRTAQRTLALSESPLMLLTQFVVKTLKVEEISAQEAISTGLVKHIEFSNSPYRQSGFNLTEESIYDSSGHVIQPIVREGRHLMTAGYPPEIRAIVEPVIESEKRNFKRILDAHSSALRKVVRLLRAEYPGSPLAEKASYYLGHMIMGLVKAAVE